MTSDEPGPSELPTAAGLPGGGGDPSVTQNAGPGHMRPTAIRKPRSSDAADPAQLSVAELVEALIPAHGAHLAVGAELDRGGMGRIDLVEDRSLLRTIVRKVLREEILDDALAVHGFIREAQVMAQLDHPNIVPVHELGTDPSTGPYFTMKRVEGKTFRQLISEHHGAGGDADSLLALLDVVVKVCDAVGFAHSRGVIHCDIKPDNVMVGGFGQVYLMDWGIARFDEKAVPRAEQQGKAELASFTQAMAGFVTGTWRCIPPEQAQGRTHLMDRRTDVFSLGALLYTVLSGRTLYPAEDANEALAAARECDPGPMREVLAKAMIPRELKDLVLRALSADRDSRQPHVEELKADLLRFIRGGASFPRVELQRGEHVIREGEEGDAAYVIVSGGCEVYKKVADRTEALRPLGPGAVFGEMAIFSSAPRSASVLAVEDTVLLRITRDALNDEVDSLKPWLGAFVRSLASRFRESEQRWFASAGEVAPEQLAHQVLLHVSTWGQMGAEGAVSLGWTRFWESVRECIPISSRDLASALRPFKEIVINLKEDSLVVADLAALKERLRKGFEV